jgi:hypothetical protein
MISIIICGTHPHIDSLLQRNIEDTIGNCDYEIIYLHNERNVHSIFELYNTGVARSMGTVCCFMHDDIIFHSKNWGVIVESDMRNQTIGAIAVAGTKYIRKAPAFWPALGNVQNIIQSDKLNQRESIHWKIASKTEQVIVFDGLWFCIRKSLFNNIRFDDITFRGFHFYDMDIALQIYQLGIKTICSNQILIEHCSFGNIDKEWFKSSIAFYTKWNKLLPISVLEEPANNEEVIRMEDVALRVFLRNLLKQKMFLHLFSWMQIAIQVKGSLTGVLRVLLKK